MPDKDIIVETRNHTPVKLTNMSMHSIHSIQLRRRHTHRYDHPFSIDVFFYITLYLTDSRINSAATSSHSPTRVSVEQVGAGGVVLARGGAAVVDVGLAEGAGPAGLTLAPYPGNTVVARREVLTRLSEALVNVGLKHNDLRWGSAELAGQSSTFARVTYYNSDSTSVRELQLKTSKR